MPQHGQVFCPIASGLQTASRVWNKMFGFKQGIAKIRAEGYKYILGVTPVKEDT